MASFDADVIVVGSGFGGATVALRLAQAGRSVLVLERGRRWAPADFPRSSVEAERIFWQADRPGWRGPYQFAVQSDMAAVVASGVGGGSLIYANVLARAPEDVFASPRWPASIRRDVLEPLYDRLVDELGATPLPTHFNLPKRNRFRAAAAAIGEPCYDPPQAVTWAGDPGPGRATCQFCASCELGCTFGAKNTLDLTSLAAMERLGGSIVADAQVTAITPAGGGYVVTWRDTMTGDVARSTAASVVLAAGTLGTLDLLFRCRDVERTLPAIGARLGQGLSVNGDFFGTIVNVAEGLDAQHGPDVTTILTPNVREREHAFTVVAPAYHIDAMTYLAAQGQPLAGPVRLGAVAWRALEQAIPKVFDAGLVRGTINVPPDGMPDPARMTNVFAIGRDNANGVASFEAGRLDVKWAFARENRAMIGRMETVLRRLAEAYGGRYAPLATWEIFRKPLTVHPMGGCPMGQDSASGVVDDRGAVHGYPGLYVADGTLVQSALGVHPALTIAALAERVAAGMIRD